MWACTCRSIKLRWIAQCINFLNTLTFFCHKWINNSLHLGRKYAWIFVRRHYLFWEANSFARVKLEENCELWWTDNVEGQISKHIFCPKCRLLSLLSFKYFLTRPLNFGDVTSKQLKAFKLFPFYLKCSVLFSEHLIRDENETCEHKSQNSKTGEYRLGHILWYSSVLAGAYSVMWHV